MADDKRDMTFEDLTSVYRTERSSASLTQVRHDLYPAMRALASEQSRKCERLAAEDPESIMFDGALERRRKINHYVKLVTELRIRKIAGGALTGAMGADHVLDKLTPEEKEFYDSVVASAKRMMSMSSDRGKRAVQDSIPQAVKQKVTPKAPEAYEPESLNDIPDFDDNVPDPQIPMPEPPVADAWEEEDKVFGKRVTVRILEDLPKFSGPDRDYELFKEDVVRMPAVMADALINRGKAKLVDVRL